MSYDNTNSGILRANKRRDKDTQPTHQGSINIDGKEYWLSAWVNTGKPGSKLEGERYFSIKAKPKDEPQKQASDWPSTGPQTTPSRARFKPGTIEGNLARASTGEEFPFDDIDKLPF